MEDSAGLFIPNIPPQINSRYIIKKELGMDAFPKDPFAWISYKDGNKLVEVLKGYVKTAQKSRGDADG